MVNISPEQLSVLNDREFLLEKKRVSQQLIHCLGETEKILKKSIKEVDFSFPPTAFIKAGKISKGESYRDLPYFVLDFPRLFAKQDVFAYRTMIRWGHEISCTLHLAGRYKAQFEKRVRIEKAQLAAYYICVNSSPWEYHFEPTNYQLIGQLSEEAYRAEFDKPFIKISQCFALNEVNVLPTLASDIFKFYLEAISNN